MQHESNGSPATVLPGRETLLELGWTSDRAAAFVPHALAGLVPGRVTGSGCGASGL